MNFDHIQPGATVVVAMSGGVDSSVVAALLKDQGYHVVGITLKTYVSDEVSQGRAKGCCTLADVMDARKVAQTLDIPYYVVNSVDAFEQKVIQPFISEYLQGRTPNPCVVCNTEIKFDFLLQKAKELGAIAVATGHYARLHQDSATGKMHLLKAVDADKDQSYVLFDLKQEQLRHTLLPLGGYTKPEVRQLAQKYGLCVAGKKDSQEICFVGAQSYREFVQKKVLPGEFKRGDICLEDGTVVGTHGGLHLFTVGQKKGLGLNSYPGYSVARLDPQTHQVIVKPDHSNLDQVAVVSGVHWLDAPQEGTYDVKIRYRHAGGAARVIPLQDSVARIEFKSPQRAITPGQAAVWYGGAEVIGGGWIQSLPYGVKTLENYKTLA